LMRNLAPHLNDDPLDLMKGDAIVSPIIEASHG